jgi:hypothetical protein
MARPLQPGRSKDRAAAAAVLALDAPITLRGREVTYMPAKKKAAKKTAKKKSSKKK